MIELIVIELYHSTESNYNGQ